MLFWTRVKWLISKCKWIIGKYLFPFGQILPDPIPKTLATFSVMLFILSWSILWFHENIPQLTIYTCLAAEEKALLEKVIREFEKKYELPIHVRIENIDWRKNNNYIINKLKKGDIDILISDINGVPGDIYKEMVRQDKNCLRDKMLSWYFPLRRKKLELLDFREKGYERIIPSSVPTNYLKHIEIRSSEYAGYCDDSIGSCAECTYRELKNIFMGAMSEKKKTIRVTGDSIYFLPFRPNVQLLYHRSGNSDGLDKTVSIHKPVTCEKLKKAHEDYCFLDNEEECLFEFYCDAKPGGENISPIKNWQDLLNQAKQNPGSVLLQMGKKERVHTMYQIIMAAGGDPEDFSDRQTEEALRTLFKIYFYAHPDSNRADWQNTASYLIEDEVAYARTWSFALSIFHYADFKDIKVTPGLGWDGEAPFNLMGGDVLAMSAHLKKDKEEFEIAMKLVEHLLSKDVQKLFIDTLAWPPLRMDTFSDSPDWLKLHKEVVIDALDNSAPMPLWWEDEYNIKYNNLYCCIDEMFRQYKDRRSEISVKRILFDCVRNCRRYDENCSPLDEYTLVH